MSTGLPLGFLYIGSKSGDILASKSGDYLYAALTNEFQANLARGNVLLTTSKITGFNGVRGAGPSQDNKGRKVHWDE